MYIYHWPPKPIFLEVFMVNNLVFRWPKPLFFMVLGAHGIYTLFCWRSGGKFHRSMSVKIFWKRKVLFGNETFFEGWLDGRSALWLRIRMTYFFKVLLLSAFSSLQIWIDTPYIAYSGNSTLLNFYFYSFVMTTDRCWVELPQTRSSKKRHSVLVAHTICD